MRNKLNQCVDQPSKETRKETFPAWPAYDDETIQQVTKVLKSGKVNYWTGDECNSFENEFASYCGVKYAISLANGTVALELALRSIGISAGDEVVVTPRTFIASASSIVAVGGVPVFADVDPVTQNITPETVRDVLTDRTRAIIAVHLAGCPCDMDELMALANQNSFYLIEDCAQAHGAKYKGRSVGGIGHVGVWSFCQDKIISTGGEGGMVTTNKTDLWEKMWSYKDHGKSWDAVHMQTTMSVYRWVHDTFGTNFRMTEMQATIGRVQLKKLDKWCQQRNKNANILTEGFRNIPGIRVPTMPSYITHAYYKYYAFIEPDKIKPGWDRNRIIKAINAEGIPVFSGSCSEVYLEKAFKNAGYGPAKRLAVAKELGETSLMFLVHPLLGSKEMTATCNVVKMVMDTATKEQ